MLKHYNQALKSTPISLNYKHCSPALTHESDLVNCSCKTTHKSLHFSVFTPCAHLESSSIQYFFFFFFFYCKNNREYSIIENKQKITVCIKRTKYLSIKKNTHGSIDSRKINVSSLNLAGKKKKRRDRGHTNKDTNILRENLKFSTNSRSF